MAEMSLLEQVKRFQLSVEQKAFEAGQIAEAEMHRIIAVDTGALKKSLTTDSPVNRGDIISVDVGSEGIPYAVYVDVGVKNKSYNYHRRSGASRPVVYSGIGQRWIERSLLAKEDEIRAKLLEARIK